MKMFCSLIAAYFDAAQGRRRGWGCGGARGGWFSGWLRAPFRFPFDKITYCLLRHWALQKGLSLKFCAQQKEAFAPFCCLLEVSLLLPMRHFTTPTAHHPSAPLKPF